MGISIGWPVIACSKIARFLESLSLSSGDAEYFAPDSRFGDDFFDSLVWRNGTRGSGLDLAAEDGSPEGGKLADEPPLHLCPPTTILTGVLVVAMVVFGVYPTYLFELATAAAGALM